MEAVIIADDLTGANDSGVQLARRGLTTSVLFKLDEQSAQNQDVIVLNTDSRASSSKEAYNRVTQVAQFSQQLSAKFIYKKIDSTLRGNIGAELDAMYDILRPDFVILAPAYPANGRTTMEGIQYLHGRPVHETDVGADKITPVTVSYVPAIVAQQTVRRTALISLVELRANQAEWLKRLAKLHTEGTPYIIADAEHEADLQALVAGVEQSGYRVIWAGSAGLAKCLPLGIEQPTPSISKNSSSTHLPVLVAVGSITERSRVQLKELLAGSETVGVRLQTDQLVLEPRLREREIARVCEIGLRALLNKQDVLLHVPEGDSEIANTIKVGLSQYTDIVEISSSIAIAMGEIVNYLLHAGEWSGIVMTGGDTATQICSQLRAERFELIDEVENGVPIGLLRGGIELYAVTKAGSFGSDAVLLNAVTKVKECSH